jgi:hypothetical protein
MAGGPRSAWILRKREHRRSSSAASNCVSEAGGDAAPDDGLRTRRPAKAPSAKSYVTADPVAKRFSSVNYGAQPRTYGVQRRIAESARKMISYPWRYRRLQIVQFGVSGCVTGNFGSWQKLAVQISRCCSVARRVAESHGQWRADVGYEVGTPRVCERAWRAAAAVYLTTSREPGPAGVIRPAVSLTCVAKPTVRLSGC